MAMTAVQAYFGELIEMRHHEPRHDLVSAALTWRLDGQPIPTEQLLSFCLLMFMAGLDTVTTASSPTPRGAWPPTMTTASRGCPLSRRSFRPPSRSFYGPTSFVAPGPRSCRT